MTFGPSFSPSTRPTRVWPGPGWKAAVTSSPFRVTGVAASLSWRTSTSTSPPLTRSGRDDSVTMLRTAAAAPNAAVRAANVATSASAARKPKAMRKLRLILTLPALAPGLHPSPPMGQSVLIHARFLAAAEVRPDALAIASAAGKLSYGQLARLSRRFAAEVRAAGGGPGRVVAILAERGPRAVVAALACAQAGAPFVILDLAYPRERLAALAAVCRPKLQLLAGGAGGLADCGPAITIDLDARRGAPEATFPE